MKFNVEIDIEEVYEDYSLSEVFKDELKEQISQKVADILAKESFREIINNPDIQAIKKEYSLALENLKNKERENIQNIENKISDVFSDFIKGTAYKLNCWGEKQEEVTVGDLLRERVEKEVRDLERKISGLVKIEAEKKFNFDEYTLRRKVQEECTKLAGDELKAKIMEIIALGNK